MKIRWTIGGLALLVLLGGCGGGGGGSNNPAMTASCSGGGTPYLVDSGVVLQGIDTQVTLYAANLGGPLPGNAVQIEPSGQSSPLTTLAFTSVAGHSDQLQATVPASLAAGTYDLVLTDAAACPTVLSGALKVTGASSVTIAAVAPSFAQVDHYASVRVTRDTGAAAPNDQPFLAAPHLFLYPTPAAPSSTAFPIPSVSLIDGNTLDAEIPPGIPAGNYDLVLVNSDGSGGVLAAGFSVKSAAPPVVQSITPASIVNATSQSITLAGTGFDTASATVSADCVHSDGSAAVAPLVLTGPASCASGACSVTATVDGSTLLAGDVCTVRLANGDGSYFDYPALGVTDSSLNLTASVAGASLNVGRRALVAAAGSATAGRRFVYAIGGDGGASVATSPFDSVETAEVGRTGVPGSWTVLAGTLTTKRTYAASATVGRYIYVMGGNDGSNALATAERAMILDPDEVPRAALSDVTPADSGLDAGSYIYRISAVYGASDPDNPNGESLASPPVVVTVPAYTGALSGKKGNVVLAWSAPVDRLGVALPNVASYRVYRSPSANAASGSEVLIATVSGTTLGFADDGSAAPGTTQPLALGSLGAWTALPNMNAAREGLAAAAAPDPVTPGTWYVYALLGSDGASSVLGSYEYLTLVEQANGHQPLPSSWSAGANTMTARWQAAAWVADSTTSGYISAPDTYVYVGGGLSFAGSNVNNVEAGKVAAGGDLGTPASVTAFIAGRAGYGACVANQQLLAFGGANASPSAGWVSAAIGATPPALASGAWNAAGNMSDSRYLPGSAALAPFVYILGGQNASAAAAVTTEVVH